MSTKMTHRPVITEVSSLMEESMDDTDIHQMEKLTGEFTRHRIELEDIDVCARCGSRCSKSEENPEFESTSEHIQVGYPYHCDKCDLDFVQRFALVGPGFEKPTLYIDSYYPKLDRRK